MSDRATATALLSPATLEHAGENWTRPLPVVEKQARGGRPPKRAKYPRCRSQEQRAFAAGILHSAMLYESLRASLHEICAMLLVRGFIDAQRVSAVLLQHGAANCTGVRPGEEVVVSDQTALDWLDANVSTRSRDAVNQAGERRLRLPDDAVGTGRGGDGHRRFASPEQLTAWVLLWADRRLELRWLGKEVGFGVFATTLIPVGAQIKPIQLRGVADYEFLDPLAMIQAYPTKSDRDAKNCSHDTVTVYGPAALINASCAEHANVSLTDEDLGVGSKKFSAERRATIEARQQVLAAYSPPKGQKWECPFRNTANECCETCC